MYDEVEYTINWGDKFKKGIIVAFVLFAIIFVILLIKPKNNLKNTNYFEDNINTMLNVAKNYYKEQDAQEKITLKEMVNKKMLLQFVDENGRYCDTNNSYAIRRNNKVEVFLKCSNQEKTTESNII